MGTEQTWLHLGQTPVLVKDILQLTVQARQHVKTVVVAHVGQLDAVQSQDGNMTGYIHRTGTNRRVDWSMIRRHITRRLSLDDLALDL